MDPILQAISQYLRDNGVETIIDNTYKERITTHVKTTLIHISKETNTKIIIYSYHPWYTTKIDINHPDSLQEILKTIQKCKTQILSDRSINT